MSGPNEIIKNYLATKKDFLGVIELAGGSVEHFSDEDNLEKMSALDLLITLSCNSIGFVYEGPRSK